MPTVHFHGRVLPEVVNVSLDNSPPVTWQKPELGLVMEFTTRITRSKIDVECKLNRWQHDDDFLPVYIRALDLCRASVDLIAFSMGYGLTVYLDTFINPDGAQSSLLSKDDGLAPLCTAFSPKVGFHEVHNMVLQEPALFMALNDLISAITLPHQSPVNCARAMDRIKHLIAPGAANDKDAWRQMRNALRVDEAYLKFITDHSAAPRHGRPGHIPGNITTEVTRRAWTVMNRYFELRKAGGSLPAHFSLLKG